MKRGERFFFSFWVLVVLGFLAHGVVLGESADRIDIHPGADDAVPTGNHWIALPSIRASDGALLNFNALSMRDRGLLEVAGDQGQPAISPYFLVDGKAVPFHNPSWQLIEYWIPTAHLSINGLDASLTYCAPVESRAAFLHMKLTNHTSAAVTVALGVNASWGGVNRITYTPVALRGERTIVPAPWTDFGQVFAFTTYDTHFAWSLIYPGSSMTRTAPPVSTSPEVEAHKSALLQPGQTVEADFVIGVGMEEYSAGQSGQALAEQIDRSGADALIAQTAAWCRKHTRSTGRADLDALMNRNYLFTTFYAWGRTLDTEQLVGITSRTERYYVSAAYWDRDAMLWSFPALLDTDPSFAREALTYALTTQLRNTGTHSRFIDGAVLEDGFELDEAVAPVIAAYAYLQKTSDTQFIATHLDALTFLRDRVLEHYDPAIGLFTTLQDAQDQYRKQQFSTYDNVLVWRALLDLSEIYRRAAHEEDAQQMELRVHKLKEAIMAHCISSQAPGAAGSIFVSATDGENPIFADVPPGSLAKLPALGFIDESDPVFQRTYAWLHSKNYAYSYSDQPYGLPGSYRLPFTTSWSVADHLRLEAGRQQALKIIHSTAWDGGIISEGISSSTGIADHDGRAFATAAGYVAHSICAVFCQERTDTNH